MYLQYVIFFIYPSLLVFYTLPSQKPCLESSNYFDSGRRDIGSGEKEESNSNVFHSAKKKDTVNVTQVTKQNSILC